MENYNFTKELNNYARIYIVLSWFRVIPPPRKNRVLPPRSNLLPHWEPLP